MFRSAKAKADLYASELGVKVGKPVKISEGDRNSFQLNSRVYTLPCSPPILSPFFSLPSSSPLPFVFLHFNLTNQHIGGGDVAASYDGTVPIGNIEISESVTINFEIDSSSFSSSPNSPNLSNPSNSPNPSKPSSSLNPPNYGGEKCSGLKLEDIQQSLLP